MWCDVMWCDVMWCDVMWCDVMWCDVMRDEHERFVPCELVLDDHPTQKMDVIMWCDVMWCDVMRDEHKRFVPCELVLVDHPTQKMGVMTPRIERLSTVFELELLVYDIQMLILYRIDMQWRRRRRLWQRFPALYLPLPPVHSSGLVMWSAVTESNRVSKQAFNIHVA